MLYNSGSNAIFHLKIRPSIELQGQFLVVMDLAYDGAYSFPLYINSIVSSNDPCNLKCKTALDTESSYMYENKDNKQDHKSLLVGRKAKAWQKAWCTNKSMDGLTDGRTLL